MIAIDGMHKWFDKFHVLKDINLHVSVGEKIVICGPSGSGKSTLIRCINRLEEHQKGSIKVAGIELTSNLKNIAEKLIDTFLEAGRIAKEISDRGVKITIKPDKTPVTDGDLAVDQLLRSKIKKLTPNIPIVSEEKIDPNIKKKDTTFWLVDPIDGTKDYINKKDEYTLNAALIIDLKPSIGLVYAPAKNRLFFSHGKSMAFEINNKKKITLNLRSSFMFPLTK